ncbi:hypothetical protein F5X68DRAFT_234546 [Plectosphaerella plurivora]|uniref:Uncharacterized protein n=1 Tax=Plectosphaerella plurivora TaxID=936078 RepID=A0A9P8V4U4_9PEZI|nr:hypothetical protein F5X68DRAFT_234546 [Plectosphaerella plurivora]
MFATLRRLAEQPSEHFTNVESTYPLRKVWPPDFTKLPPQSQFRFERKYKRRLALKAARPRWDKAVKLTQYASISFVLVYMCFHEFEFYGRPYRPVDAIVEKFKSIVGTEPESRPEQPKPTAATASK